MCVCSIAIIYIYPGETEVKKEVKIVSRDKNVYTIDTEIPTDKLFIYGNFTDALLNVNYTCFIPVLIAELQASNRRIEKLEEELLNLKKNY